MKCWLVPKKSIPSSRRAIQVQIAALARVLPLWPDELADTSVTGHLRVIGKLHRALRAERRRGISGHWTYDLARHSELVRLYRQEKKILADFEGDKVSSRS